MHESTRRLVCRTGFVLLCVVPTLVTASTIAWRSTSWHARAQQARWQTSLARVVGATLHIDEIHEPRPGEYVLRGVEARDPEAPQASPALLRVDQVQVAQTSRGLVLLATDARIDNAQSPRLFQILHERLLRGPELAALPVRISVTRLVVASSAAARTAPEAAMMLHDVRLQLGRSSQGSQLALEFRPSEKQGEPVRASVTRARIGSQAETTWALHTGGAPLPCALVSPELPHFDWLGPQSTFKGIASFTQRQAVWDARLAGTLDNVRLERLVAVRAPSAIRGAATVTLRDAQWRDGRLVTAAGSIQAQRGEIDSGFCRRAAQALELGLAWTPTAAAPQRIHFGQLGAAFELNGNGLRLSGDVPGTTPDVVLTDTHGRALAAVTSSRRLPPVALVHALLEDESAWQAPAARHLLYTLPDAPAGRTARGLQPPLRSER